MREIVKQLEEAVPFVRDRWSKTPKAGVILGSGLGAFAKEIEAEATIPYGEIPHFPTSTVESHAGQLVCGMIGDVPLVAMEGRFHYYEGYSMAQITFPVRLMKQLGAEYLFVSNACGGMNPHYFAGDIMLIEDHINLMCDNPLFGKNDDELGPRFPDMSQPYDRQLLSTAKSIALELNITAHEGVYVAVAGPNLETRAEYRFLRMIGADVVGMSTVPEVIVAAHSGMKVFGVSIVTDMCLPDALQPVDFPEIIAVANKAEPKMRALMTELIKRTLA